MTEFENVKMILDEEEEEESSDNDSTETQFKSDFECEGEMMDLRLFPQFIMYKALGAEWIAEKNGITDPFLFGLCEKIAELPMKTLGEQWEDQKQKRSDFLEINEVVEEKNITNIDKLYTE